MSKLTEESVEFAKKHIESYYDSDFFPKGFEFEAIWHCWEDVKRYLLGSNIGKLRTKHPLTMASKKPSGSYRIVHQLEPLDTIIYTALAYLIVEEIESVRADEGVACSYRFSIEDGGFFEKNSGFKIFTDMIENHSDSYKYILVTDITDFYNQIYLHRLNNAIERADPALKNIANDIESFISSINDKASQGVPVGPAASIIMSEAVLVDIDEYISNFGVEHTRYVDDIRIFSDYKEELEKVLEKLTLYLHENHRLTLASDKTYIENTEKYVEGVLHNQYEMEKVEIFETLEIFNPYSGEVEYEEVVVEERTDLEGHLNHIADQLLKRDTLDLGLARALIRKAKANRIDFVAEIIFENFEFFSPVINDVILYFKALSRGKWVRENREKFLCILSSPAITQSLVRYWVEWFFATDELLLKNVNIKRFISQSEFIENQAYAALTSKNVSWVRDNKNRVFYVGEKGKRAILRATKILPKDERDNWLKNIEKNTPEELDRWLIKWAIDTA
ncbi:RNA-directed DNA polymerase [Marinobacter sp. NP-4(2019)]|uniref:RNA-directed DNA polymerase n=1 Tax=Marinobacter sp. NP-4(2019) TaxID=2488665 RepID=UPI000FC3F32C|nr:RNA-directed DNA polymerase [Marinobacter sp. NP-4(2019)]AZT84919.1 RNA-directed DNA polymerase [Marinobacter sp. NP-4(2019)]